VSDAPVVLVFDIDGTLLHSVTEHQAALLGTYELLGVDIGDRPLSEFPDHTDSAIYALLVHEARGERASAQDFEELDAALDAEYRRLVTAAAPREVAGARELLEALAGDPRFAVTFATGSMRGAATQKLVQLGVDPEAAVVVTASDYLTREEIVSRAVELAAGGASVPAPVISIGDGIWDMRAAAYLGAVFVAVESGTHRFAGEIHAVPDLRALSPDGLIALLSATTLSSLPFHQSKETPWPQ
jgi:phosphoglycolate phosphatase-like HAD superfamily hydrolase